MAFAPDSSNVAYVLTGLSSGSWALCDETAHPEITAEGPDILELRYFGRFDGFTPDPLVSGTAPILYAGAGTWAVQSAKPRWLGATFYEGIVRCVGLAAAKGVKRRWVVGTETTSGENIYVAGVGTVPRVQARQPKVGVDLSYVQVGDPATISADAGTAKTPSGDKPATPDNWWDFLPADNYTYHAPNGWVLDGVDSEELVPGSDLWFVTEHYVYEFSITA